MKNEPDIETLLRRFSVEVSTESASSIDEIHSQIFQNAAAERRIRNSLLYGIMPVAVVVGLLSMWMMSLPWHWMAIACVANVATYCMSWFLVKRLWAD